MSVYNRRASTAVNLNQLVTNIPVRRKAADQVERENYEWNQWQSASKAINNVETPAKEKHVRNLILGTFRLEGARLFWSMMIRLQLESHPIVCWKFCYVIHRLLRDGHKHVVHDSIPLAPYFEQLGKFWSALRQSYGVMTYRYCRLMISKLTFHERNPLFHGNLSIGEQNDIRRLLNDNLDAYFQLCIELLDYMEELLGLVEVVFTSLDQSRANSMTAAGQCRLHPLIICIQDSSVLYDYIVKVLFKLHDSLPGDTLQGHRQRLVEQFRRLKRFYEQAQTLQYFKDLIKVPTLPESPPNFKLKDDIKNYQPPVAIMHTPPPEPTQVIEDKLIDTEDTLSTIAFPINDNWPPNGHMPDRSKEISDLEDRLLKCDAMLRENRSETDELHRLIAVKDTELVTERNHRLQLEEQLRQQLDNQRRVEEMHALEKKSNSDEKFNKLLEAYNKLREEHIVVLRREGEIKKQLANLNQEHTSLKDAYKKINDEFNQFKTEYEQLKSKNHEEINQEIVQLRQTNDELQDRISALTNERNNYQTTTVTATERIKEIEHVKQSVEDRYRELENEKSLINNQFENEKLEYEKRLKDAENERLDLIDKNREHEESLIDLVHEKEELEHKVTDLESATREWAQKFINTTDNQKLMQNNHTNLMTNLKQQYKYSILTHCINQMHEGIERTKDVELLNCKSGADYLLSKLRTAVESTKKTQDLWKKQLASDESSTLPFLNECISLSNCMVDIVVHGKATSNLIQDIDQSVVLADTCRDVTLQCIDLYTNYQTPSSSIDFDKLSNELTRRLNTLIDKTTTLLPKVSDVTKEELGDLVEKELQSTHETIDEAVRQLEAMMAKSREQDTGIKCEVNGQILDSCGKLMQTIKMLIIKARDLQKEIVGQGRGTATAREFYTKNHKWTEGLVSAAKNVGVNAKVLIESADHLLSGTGKFEEIIACSQEIAASTAQLVAASNVKADRESKNREGLTQASKAVNASTAQVVATAKNCAAIIEEKNITDFSSLSLHQTKRKEMDAQVKVLELEKALEQAKQQLYTLRKQHYKMAGEDAGWDQNEATNNFHN